MMVVNGLTLPASFERFIDRPDAYMVSWLPKENLDAYGNDWRTFPMEVFTDRETISERTARLPGNERLANETEELVAERNAASADRPGSIPWITDFSQILQFGRNGTDEAYCFDFRDDPHKPSVIYMDEWYWRQVAPDFETLEGILEEYDGRQCLDDRDEEIQRRRNPDYDAVDDIVDIPPARMVASQPGDADSSTVNAQPAVVTRAPLHRPGEGPGTMIVNGLSLPASFEAFIERYPPQVWDLKENVDAYGQPLVDRYGRPYPIPFAPYDTLEQITKATAMMARSYVRMVDLSNFDPERREMVKADLEAVRSGFLPTITDYSQIVEFGRAFSFDFRENLQEPSVIHMPRGERRWRQMAPNFETFIRLFEGYEQEE
jgi:hypothetical protein